VFLARVFMLVGLVGACANHNFEAARLLFAEVNEV